jgi:2-oxoglutarate ferredoxin oxidoreductase subunit gamma
MHQEIVIAGSGGQGIMVMGQLLAYAAVAEGRNVVWFPSYGPEARGGTADCTVIISAEEIGSPLSTSPDTLIAMNQPSTDRFSASVRREGVLLINTSLAEPPRDRDDWSLLGVPANDIANELGDLRIANMVMLGAYVTFVRPVEMDSIKKALAEVLPSHRHNLLPLNHTALERGAALVREPVTP